MGAGAYPSKDGSYLVRCSEEDCGRAEGAIRERGRRSSKSRVGPDKSHESSPMRESLPHGFGTNWQKLWTISKKTEFMLGAGPAWVHTNEFGMTTNSVSVELVPDFMFWPSVKHRFGWYIEPSYDYNFGRGHEQSLGVSVGLLITIPWGVICSGC